MIQTNRSSGDPVIAEMAGACTQHVPASGRTHEPDHTFTRPLMNNQFPTPFVIGSFQWSGGVWSPVASVRRNTPQRPPVMIVPSARRHKPRSPLHHDPLEDYDVPKPKSRRDE